MKGWVNQLVVQSAREVLQSTPIGAEVEDLGRLGGRGGLCVGLEAAFRDAIQSTHSAWPHGATTEGINPDLCVRTGAACIEVVGLCYIDFASEKFPIRFEITLSDDLLSLAAMTGYIGDADETGAPPRLQPSAFIVVDRDERDLNPVPMLVLKRRPTPITWTQVFSIASPLDS